MSPGLHGAPGCFDEVGAAAQVYIAFLLSYVANPDEHALEYPIGMIPTDVVAPTDLEKY